MTALPTPRERVENYLELCNSVPGDYTPPIEFQKDLRAILKANAHYETLMREAAKEAVREYKRGLVVELRRQLRKVGEMGAAAYIDDLADDLENDSL